jgi:hypothetical protein
MKPFTLQIKFDPLSLTPAWRKNKLGEMVLVINPGQTMRGIKTKDRAKVVLSRIANVKSALWADKDKVVHDLLKSETENQKAA